MDAWKTIIDKKKSGRCEKAAFIEVCKEIGYEGNPKKAYVAYELQILTNNDELTELYPSIFDEISNFRQNRPGGYQRLTLGQRWVNLGSTLGQPWVSSLAISGRFSLILPYS